VNLEQSAVTILVAIIAAFGGVAVERARQKREREKETGQSALELERARILDESARRKEIDDAARDLRDFLKQQCDELNQSLTNIESSRATEREKWNAMLGELSTKNLELELQAKRDKIEMSSLREDAEFVDDQIKVHRARISNLEVELATAMARLDACQRENIRYGKIMAGKGRETDNV
jgi:DNA-nicking Smr family endonuclease